MRANFAKRWRYGVESVVEGFAMPARGEWRQIPLHRRTTSASNIADFRHGHTVFANLRRSFGDNDRDRMIKQSKRVLDGDL